MKPRNYFLPIAAVVLIVLTNAVALGGVAWNRAGAVESQLVLSQRELRLPFRVFDRENSGLALALNWRVAIAPEKDAGYRGYYSGGAPEWLDKAKMESLGFDMTPNEAGRSRSNDRSLSRDVLLVLELDGEAYRQSLEWARQHLVSEEAKFAAMPDGNEKKNRLKNAGDELAREENESSRLFVVDAGLDAAGLRGKHPDRTRYAIVRGQVRPVWHDARTASAARGHVSNVSIAAINVPYVYRNLFAETSGKEKFTVGVAFGQRLEPWVTQLEVAAR